MAGGYGAVVGILRSDMDCAKEKELGDWKLKLRRAWTSKNGDSTKPISDASHLRGGAFAADPCCAKKRGHFRYPLP